MRLTVITLILCSIAQTAYPQAIDTLSQIDKLFSSWNNATPGGSILVARGEKILYQKAFGLADLEHNVPNTINTIFEAGSVSKQFTAYSILLLDAEGKLKLSDDVRKYVPELPVYQKAITIQMLLNHTSGLRDWGSVGSLSGWPRGTRDYTLPLALHIIFKQKSTNFIPGDDYSYSNSNYTLLVEIVQRVSKQSLEDFTRDRLFKPLGMTSTRWRSNFRDVIPGRAQAYSKIDNGYALEMPFEHIYGHGGLLTTTSDLLKWNQLLEKHDALYDKRTQRGLLNDGSDVSYAAGIQHGNVSGVAEIGHSGATAGYRAWLAYYPKKILSIILLSNEANFAPVDAGHQIAEIYFGAPPKQPSVEMPKEIPPAPQYDTKSVVGEYYSDEAECSMKVIDKDNTLFIVNDAFQEVPLSSFDKIEFIYNKGKVTGFNVSISRVNKIFFKRTK